MRFGAGERLDDRRHKYRVTDIAAQAGLSRATVDRVLHGRVGVRAETVAQVERAIQELERQRAQVHLSSKSFILDLVMQTPERFAAACMPALESELRALRPAVGRARFHIGEHSDPARAASILERIAHRGSQGVILKAPNHPEVVEAVSRVRAAGIPTVTFVTDIPESPRAAYVGVDNVAAGATAAYLITNWAGSRGGVLLTMSHSSFRGEEDRARAFRGTLRELAPDRQVHVVTDTDGLDETMAEAVRAALEAHPSVDAVYSIGGGNRAAVSAFDGVGRRPAVFVAHDLDADNLALLRTGRLTFVLHHDLKADMRRACRLLLQAGGVLPGSPTSLPSQVQVVTRYNEPAATQVE
jgi:LacI family transcriptional regulator